MWRIKRSSSSDPSNSQSDEVSNASASAVYIPGRSYSISGGSIATSIPPPTRASINTTDAGIAIRGCTNRIRLGSSCFDRIAEINSAALRAVKTNATRPPRRAYRRAAAMKSSNVALLSPRARRRPRSGLSRPVAAARYGGFATTMSKLAGVIPAIFLDRRSAHTERTDFDLFISELRAIISAIAIWISTATISRGR
jgi:hypothetical protein